MTYRVGNHQPRNLYRGDDYIGVCFDPADTALIVGALEGRPSTEPIVAELRALLTAYVDDETCHYDHHGDCQTHLAMHEGRCANAAAKELLSGDPHPRPIRTPARGVGCSLHGGIARGTKDGGTEWISCAPDVCGHTPPGTPSAPPAAEQPTAKGSGRADASETLSGRFEILAEATADGTFVTLLCRCGWSVDMADPIDLAELNRRADEHAEGCR